MINPLDMKGPEFLAFYFIYGLGVFLLGWWLRVFLHRAAEMPAGPRWNPGIYPSEVDAPAIALLRSGPEEVARVILGKLVAEGFLVLNGSAIGLPAPPPQDRSRLTPLDEEVLRAVSAAAGDTGIVASEALSRTVWDLKPRLEPIQEELESAGLAPGPEQRRGYHFLGLAALVMVTGFGAVKLLVALARGRGNVQYLLLLMAVSLVLSVFLMKPPAQTAAGHRYLEWLRRSHEGLAILLSDGRRQSFGELTLVAAIFGIDYLPMLSSLQAALVPPPRARSDGGCGFDSGGGDASSGSSCSSGGGSCSSGCGGGGGCGGGCGGCGG
ncbi:MAG TPA: TIGR04222 domain-containing membrane protein [Thermoanaerobaculia bacterium]|jgi:uncharacterized protein (TIGR04222 family)|nr:TIGR04222 domain-containing membrane protein [Thermoanaerobaculia bacterium]